MKPYCFTGPTDRMDWKTMILGTVTNPVNLASMCTLYGTRKISSCVSVKLHAVISSSNRHFSHESPHDVNTTSLSRITVTIWRSNHHFSVANKSEESAQAVTTTPVLRNTVTFISGSNHHFAVTNRCGHHTRLYPFPITSPLITTTITAMLRCIYGHNKLSMNLRTNSKIRIQAFCIRVFTLHQPTKLNPPLSQLLTGDFLSRTSRRACTTILS